MNMVVFICVICYCMICLRFQISIIFARIVFTYRFLFDLINHAPVLPSAVHPRKFVWLNCSLSYGLHSLFSKINLFHCKIENSETTMTFIIQSGSVVLEIKKWGSPFVFFSSLCTKIYHIDYLSNGFTLVVEIKEHHNKL